MPFEIPDSWEWVHLDHVAISDLGKTLDKAKNTGEFQPYLCSINVYWNGIDLTKLKEAKFEESELSKYLLRKGDLLICEGGEVGRCCIWDKNIPMYYQNALHRVRFFDYTNPHYFKYLMELYKGVGIIDAYSKGVTIKHLVQKSLNSIYFPLPPLSEQHRIVAKIEELLPFIEKYAQAETQLTVLNTSFPEALKKSILQEAVQGRLVPQDPNDEPASVLLERIRAEKQALIKAGKIKKDKHESVIVTRDKIPYEIIDGKEHCIADEVPFEIPDSWEWCRFGNAMVNRDSERIPLSVAEREKLDKIYDYYGASGVIDKVDKFLFNKPLLLIGEDGANLLLRSKPIAFIAKGEYWVNNHAHVLDTVGGLFMEYISVYINAINLSPYVTGTAQPKMNQEKMNSILVPIPPLEEQHRIVAKIEQLLPIINQISK